MVSLKKNVLANYVGRFYQTIIGIVMVPMYVRYMGVEAYGLVGFFTLLQAWFQLLDIGLTPTMVRESARFQGGATDALHFRRLLRALEGIFLAVGLIGCICMVTGASRIATHWLQVQHLSLGEVRQAVILMAFIVSLRWIVGLYRGVINGFERLVWLNAFNILVATSRFVLVIFVFKFVGTRPVDFFGYQLVVTVIEVAVAMGQTYRLLPKVPNGNRIAWDWAPLRKNLRFSLSIAFTAGVWVLVTQTDKLILSRILPLTEYAYYTMAVMAAGGVMLIGGPVSAALLPRLSRLSAEGNETGLIDLYRNATQTVAVIAVPASLVLAFFAEKVLWAWTGNTAIAHQAAPILRLYAVGNGFLVLAAFPYYLQFAKGNLRLHLLGNIIFAMILIPAVIWATIHYGGKGAGWVWLGSNAGFFLFWTPIIHRRFARNVHVPWLFTDIAPIVLGSCSMAMLVHATAKWPVARLHVAVILLLIGVLLMLVAAVGSSWVRNQVKRVWSMWFPIQE